MTREITLRSIFAFLIIILGNLQAWDSDVFFAGLWIVVLVSFAIALPAVALLLPLKQIFFLLAIVLALILLVIARLIAPIPLPGLFLVLVPSAMGFIYKCLIRETRDSQAFS